MSRLIEVDKSGVVWVESDAGDAFGIISQNEILDLSGIKIDSDTLSVLEENNFELNQDWARELTFLEFVESNGEICRVEFFGGNVNILVNDEI